MHFYSNKRKIASDRPHGINTPCISRRLIKCTSGDTLTFTATVTVPSTKDPVKKTDLSFTNIYVALAENRFSPVIWAGSIFDRWIVLDEYRSGLVHITVPRTVMGVLRRGSYLFSVVVDDGIVRETQLTGNFQIEYEPTGSINDIPYRRDQTKGDPISLNPEIDLAAQEHSRLTYEQLVAAVATISRTLLTTDRVLTALFGACDYSPTEGEVDYAVKRLSRLIIWDDNLRARIQTVSCDKYDPTFDELVERVCILLDQTGLEWKPEPCRPEVD